MVEKIVKIENWKSTFFCKKKLNNGHFEAKAYGESKFFLEIPKKIWDRALKNMVPDFCWLNLRIFP